jgi:hypothetical protein
MRISKAIAVLLLCFLPVASFGAVKCDPDAFERIAIVAAMMAVYPDELPKYVAKNKALLGEQSSFNICLNHFIKQLSEKDLAKPSRKEIVKTSMEIAAKHGRSDLGERVAEDLMENRQDTLKVSQYLNNTANAVLTLLSDDLEQYRHTAFYQQNAYTWHSMRDLFQPDDVAALQKITNDLNVWYFTTLSRGVRD